MNKTRIQASLAQDGFMYLRWKGSHISRVRNHSCVRVQ